MNCKKQTNLPRLDFQFQGGFLIIVASTASPHSLAKVANKLISYESYHIKPAKSEYTATASILFYYGYATLDLLYTDLA